MICGFEFLVKILQKLHRGLSLQLVIDILHFLILNVLKSVPLHDTSVKKNLKICWTYLFLKYNMCLLYPKTSIEILIP